MAFEDNALKQGDKGAEVVELQMRLAGFRGTVPDGDYGGGTNLQVTSFQRDYMKMKNPTGQADKATLAALKDFAGAFPVDFKLLVCPCGKCGGFGKGQFKGQWSSPNHVEAYYRYEYPGVHRMILWAYRAAQFYAKDIGWKLTINSGYRCSIDNMNHGRSSTNHCGKAIDVDIMNPASKMIDMQNCDRMRGLLVEKANAQIGWGAKNRKSLEPREIAPTWVHYDVRSYDPKYLDDSFFVKTAAALDGVAPKLVVDLPQ
jgi:hypothetical protein